MLSVDRERVHAIARLRDEIGVLSVYATADPRQEAASSPAWPVQIRNELSSLRHRLRDSGDHRRLAALRSRLPTLEPMLLHLLDAGAAGRGRALFASLGRFETHSVSTQLPLITGVVLDPVAYLYPLVAAYSVGAPAGIVVVTAHDVRVIDYRLGLAQPVWTVPYEQSTDDWRELTGPAAGNPKLGQRSVSQRDLYERRVTDHLTRFLSATSDRLVEFVDRAGWEDLVVTGENELVAALVAGLPHHPPTRIVTAAHVPAAALPPAHVADMVAPDLHAARQRRRRQLAEQARDAALSGGAGAYGLADTLSALAEGRVAHLLLQQSGHWAGRRAPDGRLCPEGEVPPGTTAGELVAEPDLAERMIEETYRHGGEVTLLDDIAAEPLAAGAGVAAILRW